MKMIQPYSSIIVLICVCFNVYAQLDGKVVFALANYNKKNDATILVQAPAKTITFNKYKSWNGIYAYYSTSDSKMKIDSICYSISFYNRDYVTYISNQIIFYCADNWICKAAPRFNIYNTKIVIKVNKIILENGQEILNPLLEGYRSKKMVAKGANKKKVITKLEGVIFTIK